MARDLRYGIGFDVDNTSDVRDAAEDLDRLAAAAKEADGAKVDISVEADTDTASRNVEDFIADLDGLSTDTKTVTLGLEAATVTRQLEDIAAEIRELAGTDVDISAKITGANQLQSDLERLEAEIKAINSTEISPRVDTSGNLARARGGIDDISDSARGANSALANMVGNAAQDVGALGGIAGSAGVAIGQMAEYAADAALGGEKLSSSLKSMALVAGPIAAIMTGVSVLSGLLGDLQAQAAAAEARVQAVGDAMEGSAVDSVGLAEALKADLEALRHVKDESASVANYLQRLGGSLPLVGGFLAEQGEDMVAVLNRAGASMYDLAGAGLVASEGWKTYSETIREAHAQGKITSDELERLIALGFDYSVAWGDAAEQQKLFNVDAREANDILAETVAKADPLAQFAEQWSTLFADMRDGSIDTQAAADAINQLAEGLGLTQSEVIALAHGELDKQMENAAEAIGETVQQSLALSTAVRDARLAMLDSGLAAEAFADAMEQVNQASQLDFSQMALDTVASFDAMKESLVGLKEVAVDWSSVDLSPDSVEELRGIPDELAAVTDGISGMRDTIQTELQAAFDTGGIEAYIEKAAFFRREVGPQFRQAFIDAGAGPREADRLVRELMDDLELLPKDVQIQVQLTRQEEARNALAAFASVIELMPESVQVAINARIAEGDVEAALELLNTQLIQRGYDPIVLPVDANTKPAREQIGGVEKGKYSATVATGAETGAARGSIRSIEEGDYQATVDAGANTEPAKGGIRDVEEGSYEAEVATAANTKEATTTIDNFIGEDRTASVYIGFLNLSTARESLDLLTQGRTALITADASTYDAEVALNYTARPRDSFVYQHVVPGNPSVPSAQPVFVPNADGTPRQSFAASSFAATVAPLSRSLGPATVVQPINNVTVQAAVIGNRFDVMRTVRQALKESARLNGSRRFA